MTGLIELYDAARYAKPTVTYSTDPTQEAAYWRACYLELFDLVRVAALREQGTDEAGALTKPALPSKSDPFLQGGWQ